MRIIGWKMLLVIVGVAAMDFMELYIAQFVKLFRWDMSGIKIKDL